MEVLLLVLGAAVGAGGAWLAARGHFGALVAAEREKLGSRVAIAETQADEARKQLTQREVDLGELRVALDTERTQRSAIEARAAAEREGLDAQRRLVEEARARLSESFQALSAEALRQSSTQFLQLAQQKLDAQLSPREEAIKGLVDPLKETLSRYEKHLRELEAARQSAYGSLEEQLRTLHTTSERLQRETGTLATALSRSSQARGQYGEVALRRIIELAGMTARCDFSEQVHAAGDGGRVRPDVVVHLPDRRDVVIDAKAPLSAYFEAVASTRADEREAALARHASQLRAHMTQLGSKTYWAEFAQSADFVVMFVPAESSFMAALEADDRLLVDAMEKRVVIATPTTLIALLLAVHHGWRQAQMAESAERISKLGRELYERLRTMGHHFEKVRRGLGQATEAYNAAVGSLEGRVLPAARKLEELGLVAGETIATLEPIDQTPRAVTAPELLIQETLPDVDGAAPSKADP
ncbi:MAG TPA: DNA recombination protein RmuC [Terriglobales bacterium]|nr:DNA recombination protein RmuC [Terriglobales bacterium]